jgi:hypothetical protein
MHLPRQVLSLVLSVSLLVLSAPASPDRERHVDLSPSRWPAGEYAKYMKEQAAERMNAGSAAGVNGAVTVSYNALAARAGLEALKQGGNAIDAALTTALTQVALTAGAPISYFGIMSLVYFEKKSGKVYTMNAEWNTSSRMEPQFLALPRWERGCISEPSNVCSITHASECRSMRQSIQPISTCHRWIAKPVS